jgi:PTS system nitrogen regulatory IIA component
MRRRIYLAGFLNMNGVSTRQCEKKGFKKRYKMQQNMHVDLILPRVKAATAKQVFEILSAAVADSLKCSQQRVFEEFSEKHKVENFSIGGGVCIPHLKMRGTRMPLVILATTEKPVDLNAPDDQPVNIVCALISPEEEGQRHLQNLSKIARMLKNASLAQKLRDAADADTMRFLLINPEGWLLAA